MNIRTRLFLAFFALTMIPLVVFGYGGFKEMQSTGTYTLDESTRIIKEIGEDAIRQKAEDTARQVDLYLEAHPDLLSDPDRVMTDLELATIAVQPVGETGYTALYDSSGITYFHSNPNLVGQDMHSLAESLPEFWAIFAASLDGTPVGSYYVWKEADGSLRDKYMACVPVGKTQLRIAATTYIDEFYAPIRQAEANANRIYRNTILKGIIAMFSVAAVTMIVALRLSTYISNPVLDMIHAATMVENGNFSEIELESVSSRKDELGGLGRVFATMVDKVKSREQTLKDEVTDLREKVQLYIEIDNTRRERAVREITETEYFDDLVKRADLMRRARTQTD